MTIKPKTELSILIPTYNNSCLDLIQELNQQASLLNIKYEIILAEDGSDDYNTININNTITEYSNCQHIINKKNIGRASIRNFLVSKSRYKYLIFIDSDMVIPSNDYLKKYIDCPCESIIYGGIIIRGDSHTLGNNLRYAYEKNNENKLNHTLRQRNPYKNFHTANFLVAREIMLNNPFDERFKKYGYEDVLFGKALSLNNIEICHIDNPLSFEVFEENADFINKTEVGLQTLFTFREELSGYNQLLEMSNKIRQIKPLEFIFNFVFKQTKKGIRNRLIKDKPRIWLFNIYRLGYYLSLTK